MSSFPGVIRRYYVGVVHRYAPALSTTTYNRSTLRTCSIGRLFQNLSDAHTHLSRTPVCASVDARTRIRALGGNFIMTRTVHSGTLPYTACSHLTGVHYTEAHHGNSSH